MDENSRIPQRTRPRPYDLRRKVLLKNFLREQMTHIPFPPTRSSEPSLEVNNVSDIDQDPSTSIGNEENIETPNNVLEKVSSSSSLPEPIPSTSTDVSTENQTNCKDSPTNNDSATTSVDKNSKPKVSRFSNLLKLKLAAVNMSQRGIVKAKVKGKAPSKGVVLRDSNKTTDSENSTKNRTKSFFSMFKAHKNKKRNKMFSKRKTLTPPLCTTPVHNGSTSNRSVQTDASWSQEEYNNMEQSNRSLREENKLLSESLSSFMSDFNFQLSPLRIPYGTDSYISATSNSELSNTVQRKSVDVAKRNNRSLGNDYSRTRVLRSKSMQDRPDRKNHYKSRLRTRSMNQGLSRRFMDSSSLASRDYNRQSFSAPMPSLSHCTLPRAKYKPNHLPPSEPNFSRQRVSVSSDSTKRISPYKATVLKNLPINNSNRIVRRSSMPERTSYQPTRPILRHRSTRVRSYNRQHPYEMEHVDHNYNLINRKSSVYPRANSNGGYYSGSVPFQNLPPEAFY